MKNGTRVVYVGEDRESLGDTGTVVKHYHSAVGGQQCEVRWDHSDYRIRTWVAAEELEPEDDDDDTWDVG